MPKYVYRCPQCGIEEEITHSMSEIDTPSCETIEKTTCNQYSCPQWENEFNSSTKVIEWDRIPQCFNFAGSDPIKNNPQKMKKHIKERKIRSKKHFKKEVMPEIGGVDRLHFIKKYGQSK